MSLGLIRCAGLGCDSRPSVNNIVQPRATSIRQNEIAARGAASTNRIFFAPEVSVTGPRGSPRTEVVLLVLLAATGSLCISE